MYSGRKRDNIVYCLLVLFTLVCINDGSFAQSELTFSQIDNRQGLSDNRVRDITQLLDGRMIVCTVGITNLFDGTTFKQLHEKAVHVASSKGYNDYNQTYTDGRYLWIKTTRQVRLIDLNREAFVPHPDCVLQQMGNGDPVVDFFMDVNCNYWMLTTTDQLIVKPVSSSTVRVFQERISYPVAQKETLCNVAVLGNEVFLFYANGLMLCYDLTTRKRLYQTTNLSANERVMYGTTLKIAQSGDMIYVLHSGKSGMLKQFNTKTRVWTTLLKTDYDLRNISINPTSIMVSCKAGLWVINKTKGEAQLLTKFRLVDGTDVHTEAFALYNDKQGGLWIGTLNHGLLYYHPDRFKFSFYGKTYFQPQASDIDVTCFLDLDDRRTLVGTSNGLYMFDRRFNTMSLFKGVPAAISCLGLVRDAQGLIWMPTSNQGVYTIEAGRAVSVLPKSKQIRRISRLGSGLVLTDAKGDSWLFDEKTKRTLLVTNASAHSFPKLIYPLIPFSPTTVLGLSLTHCFLYDYTQKTTSYPFDGLLKTNIKPFTCCATDRRGFVWIGTMDGLYVCDVNNKKSYPLYADNGLVNNNIKGILEDNDGTIWVTTAGGISRITVVDDAVGLRFSIRNFNANDGLITNEFVAQSVYKSSGKSLFFGGINGFNVLDLNKSWGGSKLSRPIFTNFFLSGTAIKAGEEHNHRVVLPRTISTTDTIELRYNQNYIRINFSALNYINPSQTYYRYRLLGSNDQWSEIAAPDGTGFASFTNLEPGRYLFQVKAANNSNEWSTEYSQLTLIIQPPFWKTTVAYLVYLLLLGALVYSIVAYYKRRTQRLQVRSNEEKLNQMKFDFFTNISHEFRTPLTLILTPLESMLKEAKGTQLEPTLRTMRKQAEKLLGLVTELLDFRRLEMVGEKLQLSYGNIADVVRQYQSLFKTLAEEKHIQFTVSGPEQAVFMYFDENKVHRILSNLISNAFKFSTKGGSVLVRLSKLTEQVKLECIDMGPGIPAQEISSIFNRFYRATDQQQGSGIGLYLVKEYVLLHGGTIAVESEPGNTVFTVTLPTTLTPERDDVVSDGSLVDAQQLDASPENKLDKPNKNPFVRPQTLEEKKGDFTLLLVEDNTELRHFMVSELQKTYRVIEAADGIEGLSKAHTCVPDLIISDVMMPNMDGYELCRKLKSDMKTSHIPVMLLTAKATEEHRFEGYKAGADEYISKPFNLDFLALRVDQLLKQQHIRKEQFIKNREVNPAAITISSLDERLLQKALDCVERNLSNTDYSVYQMSLDMNMDRTVLYKKVHSITGLTPSEFIRTLRLKRAAQLLEQGNYPVAEVSEMVGFKTQRYFSNYFKVAFGVLPSQYRTKKS